MTIINAILTCRTMLPETGLVQKDYLEQVVGNVLRMDMYKNVDRNLLVKELYVLYRVHVDPFRVIESRERKRPWIKDKSIQWQFWDRYKSYLQFKKNFAPSAIDQIDKLTNRILDGLYDPVLDVGFDKKGLVVGQVQSGKTSNYTGLICKAVDAGYNMIIVLAGMHNNLRTQTQLRIDEGFLGFDTKYQRAFNTGNSIIGAGVGQRIYPAHSFTSNDNSGDFSKAGVYPYHTNEPIIAVVKKQISRLKYLNQWIEAHAIDDGTGRKIIADKKLLLIDDEADNASINVSNDPDKRSGINKEITKLLGYFLKSGYVGYTATPFANIFIPIDEKDIFPRDFIINLPAPSNYIGPEKVFGTQYIDDEEPVQSVLPIVNRINDYGSFVPEKHKKDDQLPSSIPESLKRAIRCFIITCAIRRLRGQENEHNSMLVHVTRYVRWQNQIRDLIQHQFDFYKLGIDQNMPQVIEEFRNTFLKDDNSYKSYKKVTNEILKSDLASLDPLIKEHAWEEVLAQLNDAAKKIEVKEVNGGSGDVLSYFDHPNGLSVIAVGGDKLSRGLTLEGLSISYYLRASTMYDTLMQMGRWFGYRHGYVDLCRLFTSRELNEWFCHITSASEELRSEFDYMADVADSTPEKYALKVRSLPGTLQISSLIKMKQAVYYDLSYSAKLIQTTVLLPKEDDVNYNKKVVETFLNKINCLPIQDDSKLLFRNVSPDIIINEFLTVFKLHPDVKTLDPTLIKQYINKCNKNGELINWTVAVFNSQDKQAKQYTITIHGEQFNLGLTQRSPEEGTSDILENTYMLNNSAIISPRHEFVDIESLPEKTTGKIVRNVLRPASNALLMIYPLDPSKIGGNYSLPIYGFAISFSRSPSNVTTKYAVHNQMLQYLDWEDDFTTNEEEEEI